MPSFGLLKKYLSNIDRIEPVFEDDTLLTTGSGTGDDVLHLAEGTFQKNPLVAFEFIFSDKFQDDCLVNRRVAALRQTGYCLHLETEVLYFQKTLPGSLLFSPLRRILCSCSSKHGRKATVLYILCQFCSRNRPETAVACKEGDK